jgi:TetR/AcrR family transcriptional repressor of nem operon
MKVSRAQVAENREKILSSAARLFRERGFDGVTVAEVMSEAGLTHGGFYGYFKSKDELIAKAFAHVLGLDEAPQTRAPPSSVAHYAKSYLSKEHRDNPGGGCTFATLGSEAARAGPSTRRALTEGLSRLIERLAQAAAGRTREARRRDAIGALSAMIGGLVLARLADDEKLSKEILASAQSFISPRS